MCYCVRLTAGRSKLHAKLHEIKEKSKLNLIIIELLYTFARCNSGTIGSVPWCSHCCV